MKRSAHASVSIELGDAAKHHCPCCQLESETVHGFLYEDGGATAVYFAGYTHGHPVRRANMVISVGGWGEGTGPADRRAIALQVSNAGDELVFTFAEAEGSPWYGDDLLGKMSEPDELSDDDRVRFEQLVRSAIEQDPRVAGYLTT